MFLKNIRYEKKEYTYILCKPYKKTTYSSLINKCVIDNKLLEMISKLAISNPISITGCKSRNMHSLHSNLKNWHHRK